MRRFLRGRNALPPMALGMVLGPDLLLGATISNVLRDRRTVYLSGPAGSFDVKVGEFGEVFLFTTCFRKQYLQ